MAGGLRRTVLAAVVATAALAAPAAALAGGGPPSAVSVYVEQAGNAGGGVGPGTGKPSSLAEKRCAQLANAGKTGKLLCALLTSPALGATGGLRDNGSGGGPGTFGAVWNLGAGPTLLLALLLASFVAVFGRDGWRVWRRRGVAVP